MSYEWKKRSMWKSLAFLLALLLSLGLLSFLSQVKAAPGNFGYDTIGSSEDFWGEREMYGSWFTTPSDVDEGYSITLYCQDQGNQAGYYIKGVLVDRTTKTIIENGVTNPADLPANWAWVTMTFSVRPSLIPNTDYIISAISNSPDTDFKGEIEADKMWYDITNSYTNPEDPTSGKLYDFKASIYCTYTPTGEPTPSPSPSPSPSPTPTITPNSAPTYGQPMGAEMPTLIFCAGGVVVFVLVVTFAIMVKGKGGKK